MNIFMITSVPLSPPWDQGDKNLAYALTVALPEHRFRALTTCDGLTPLSTNLDPEPVYQSRNPSLVQKVRVYLRLLRIVKSPKPKVPSPKSQVESRDLGLSIDLYHLIYRPYALSSWLCRLLPEFRRRPTLHTVPATADGRPLGRHLFFADRLVVLSEHGRQALRRLGLDHVVHIPPGIAVDRWVDLSSQTAHLKAQLGLTGHPVVLFPGHYSPGYGTEVMLQALPHIAAQVPGVRIIFACRLRAPGDRERERAAYRTLARQGLTEAVRFYNTVADMRPLIGASDLTVLPLETMRDKVDIPTTLLESLAAGKPVVISNLPPMNEVLAGFQISEFGIRNSDLEIRNPQSAIRNSDVGLAVPPGDAHALAEVVSALLKDAGARARMGRQGQELVQARFDIRQVARRYAQLYQEMAQ